MGALANATALRRDQIFADWIETAMVYQARLVIAESPDTPDHATRLLLAREAAFTPGASRGLFVTVVATDPDVAVKGATPDLVGENLVITKVHDAWTAIARLVFPNG